MKSVVIHKARDLRIEERKTEDLLPGEVAVAVKAGGICGSDLHYYNNGGFGAIRVIDPMVLGHEVAGEVTAVGSGVEGLEVGTPVAVNPSRPCGDCKFCYAGQHNQCLDMRFYGSAMRRPHIHGAFSQSLVADARQCVVLPQDVSLNEAACAEPLSVALHACGRAGSLVGKRVLVSGCGPIGCFTLLAARTFGAHEIIATDLVDEALDLARRLGADATYNPRHQEKALAKLSQDKGVVDVLFEASGSAAALTSALDWVRPGGTIVQMGLGGDLSLPMNSLVTKEIELKGTFRFHKEYETAARMIAERRIDVRPVISHVLPLSQAIEAFDLANDRTRSMKVQIDFAEA